MCVEATPYTNWPSYRPSRCSTARQAETESIESRSRGAAMVVMSSAGKGTTASYERASRADIRRLLSKWTVGAALAGRGTLPDSIVFVAHWRIHKCELLAGP